MDIKHNVVYVHVSKPKVFKARFVINNQVIYICVSFWLLAHESRDLSQAETKITLVKS